MRNRLAAILEFLRIISLDPVGATGAVLATLGGSLFALLVLLSLTPGSLRSHLGHPAIGVTSQRRDHQYSDQQHQHR